jgi:dTDP-4-dehydrorhamnose reductase
MLKDHILVIGSNGRLGQALLRRWRTIGVHVQAIGRNEIDLANPAEIGTALAQHDFTVVINTAGLTDVDYCEANPEVAWNVNVAAPLAIAQCCEQRGARMVQLSTDYVFDGTGREPLTETAVTQPLSVYGRNKLESEHLVMAACPASLVLRVSWLFGIEKSSFPDRIVRQGMERFDITAVDDKWACPTFADDVADWLLALLGTAETGVFHLANSGECTWLEYANEALSIAHELGLPMKATTARGHTMQGFPAFLAPRPAYSVLATERLRSVTGRVPRSWQSALRDYLTIGYGQEKLALNSDK